MVSALCNYRRARRQRLNGCGRKLKIQSTPHRKMVYPLVGITPILLDSGTTEEIRQVGVGKKELACGGQAFIATPLFDSSMSALPIIVSQKSPSVGLFTH